MSRSLYDRRLEALADRGWAAGVSGRRSRHDLVREMADYALAVIAAGAVAYYRLDEVSGRPKDSIGSNHATSSAALTYSQPGFIRTDPPNTAISFNGSTSEFQVPDANALDLGDVVTLAFWIQTTSSAEQWIISKGTNAYGVALSGGSGGGPGKVHFAQTNVDWIAYSKNRVDDGLPHFVVCTKNGATRKVYVDGVDQSDTSKPNLTLTNTATNLLISRSPAAGSRINGVLDEVALFPTALTAAQVVALYNAAGYATAPQDAGVFSDYTLAADQIRSVPVNLEPSWFGGDQPVSPPSVAPSYDPALLAATFGDTVGMDQLRSNAPVWYAPDAHVAMPYPITNAPTGLVVTWLGPPSIDHEAIWSAVWVNPPGVPSGGSAAVWVMGWRDGTAWHASAIGGIPGVSSWQGSVALLGEPRPQTIQFIALSGPDQFALQVNDAAINAVQPWQVGNPVTGNGYAGYATPLTVSINVPYPEGLFGQQPDIPAWPSLIDPSWLGGVEVRPTAIGVNANFPSTSPISFNQSVALHTTFGWTTPTPDGTSPVDHVDLYRFYYLPNTGPADRSNATFLASLPAGTTSYDDYWGDLQDYDPPVSTNRRNGYIFVWFTTEGITTTNGWTGGGWKVWGPNQLDQEFPRPATIYHPDDDTFPWGAIVAAATFDPALAVPALAEDRSAIDRPAAWAVHPADANEPDTEDLFRVPERAAFLPDASPQQDRIVQPTWADLVNHEAAWAPIPDLTVASVDQQSPLWPDNSGQQDRSVQPTWADLINLSVEALLPRGTTDPTVFGALWQEQPGQERSIAEVRFRPDDDQLGNISFLRTIASIAQQAALWQEQPGREQSDWPRWFTPDDALEGLVPIVPPPSPTTYLGALFFDPEVVWSWGFTTDAIEPHFAGTLQDWLQLTWDLTPRRDGTTPAVLIDATTGDPYLHLTGPFIVRAD